MKFYKNIKIANFLVLSILLIAVGCSKEGGDGTDTFPLPKSTFKNPVIKGADPYVLKQGDNYYYMHTVGNLIRVWQTQSMPDLANSFSRDVFKPTSGPNSKNIWAPEMYKLDNKWYIYYTAGDGQDINQRTWVLENTDSDPMQGDWISKGKISHPDADFWAIDGTIMEYNSKRYFIWCGRPDKTNNDKTQKVYISEMSNPWTLTGPVTLLVQPQFSWEQKGFGVIEGPEILKGPKGYFLIYSASFCGTDDYTLGMMTLKENGDPLKVSDWKKSDNPVFVQKPSSKAYGPGHNGFFKSPNGKEDWIIYHANSDPGQGCGGNRTVRMQKFTFDVNGVPNFGEPVSIDLEIDKPGRL